MITRLAVALFAIALLGGCQGEPGIAVRIKAEPHAGYRMPERNGYGNLDSSEGDEHDFHPIDYDNVDDIVVWVEPVGPPNPQAPAPSSQSGEHVRVAGGGLVVASVGDTLEFHLSDVDTASYFLRSESGEIMPLSPQNPVLLVNKPCVLELVGNDSEDAITTIFVAPTRWAKPTVAGKRLTFTPLIPGRYKVSAWHPILPGGSQVVDVAASGLSSVALTIGVNSLPKPR